MYLVILRKGLVSTFSWTLLIILENSKRFLGYISLHITCPSVSGWVCWTHLCWSSSCIHPVSTSTAHYHQWERGLQPFICQGFPVYFCVSWMETFPVWDYTVMGQEVSDPWSSLQVSFLTYRTGVSCSNLPTLSSTRTLLGVCMYPCWFWSFKGQGEMYSFNWVPWRLPTVAVRPPSVVRWSLHGTSAVSQGRSDGLEVCHGRSRAEGKKTWWNCPKITKICRCNKRRLCSAVEAFQTLMLWYFLPTRFAFYFPLRCLQPGLCVLRSDLRGRWHQRNIWSLAQTKLPLQDKRRATECRWRLALRWVQW